MAFDAEITVGTVPDVPTHLRRFVDVDAAPPHPGRAKLERIAEMLDGLHPRYYEQNVWGRHTHLERFFGLGTPEYAYWGCALGHAYERGIIANDPAFGFERVGRELGLGHHELIGLFGTRKSANAYMGRPEDRRVKPRDVARNIRKLLAA